MRLVQWATKRSMTQQCSGNAGQAALRLFWLSSLLLVFLGDVAQGYHLAGDFEESAVKGGGGGLWFTGAPRWKKYDCRACHTDSPGQIEFEVRSVPALIAGGAYIPNQNYKVEVLLIGEHAGLDSAANINLIGLEFVNSSEDPVGSFSYEEIDFLEPVPELGVLFSQPTNNTSSWEFHWRAPPEGQGRITLYLAGLDGNGNNVATGDDSGLPGSDPRGDDVAMLAIELSPSSGALLTELAPSPDGGCNSSQGTGTSSLVLLSAIFLLCFIRRLSHSREHE